MRKLLIALIVVSMAAASHAGTVTLELNNGTRLVGTVIKEANGKIFFHADLVGDVEIDLAAVARRTEDKATPSAEPSDLPKAEPVVPALSDVMNAAPKEG